MTAWILTLGLQNLRAQVDATFPGRDKASDGTIGDALHQAGISGHDPDDVPNSHAEWNGDPDSIPEVRAWDMDNNLAPGLDCQLLVDHIRALPNVSSVLRYMIYNRLIYEAANGWKARDYTGPSPHLEHVHFSGAYSQAADNNQSFNYRLEEIPVALTAADKTWISAEIAAQCKAAVAASFALGKQKPSGTPTSVAGNALLWQGIPDGTVDGAPSTATWTVLRNLGQHLIGVEKAVDELAARLPARP